MPISNDAPREVTVITIHAKFGAAATSYAKDVEIYRAGEPAGRVFEVIHGAVRSYKVLSDGRRQICSFHLPNDVFGLEYGPNYRFTAAAIVDTAVRVVRRHSLEYMAASDVGVARDLLSMTAETLKHAKTTCCYWVASWRWRGWRLFFWRWTRGWRGPA